MRKSIMEYSKEANLPNIQHDYKGTKSINDVGFDSTKKVLWVCKNGHCVEESPHVRLRRKGAFCPVCGKNGKGSLEQIYPTISKMYSKNNKLPAGMIPCDSSLVVEWECKKGHKWKRSIKAQTIIKTCPVCSKKIPSEDYSFFKKHPELLVEWDEKKNTGIDVSKILPNSNKKYWWICNKKHSYLCTVADRNRGKGCPYCAGKKVTEENSVAKLNPLVLKYWDYEKNKAFLPTEISPTSKRKIWVIIDGKSEQITITDLVKKIYK